MSRFQNSLALAKLRGRFPGARRVAFGDLFLEDVREYREQLPARSI